MRGNTGTFFELIRVANVFTAAADVVAGYLCAGGSSADFGRWGPLCLASCCLYSGGMALNDAWDAPKDASERPERPIPSGRISRHSAFRCAGILLAAGVIPAAWVSANTGAVAATMVAAIVLYDVLLKKTILAPATMGVCRALNLLLGMIAAGPMEESIAILPMVILWLYVTSLTEFARREATGGNRNRLLVDMGGILVAVMAVPILPTTAVTQGPFFVVLLLTFLLALLCIGQRAIRSTSPADVRSAVGFFVLGIVVLDACMVTRLRGIEAGSCLLVLLLPATWLSRRYRVS